MKLKQPGNKATGRHPWVKRQNFRKECMGAHVKMLQHLFDSSAEEASKSFRIQNTVKVIGY